MENKSYLLKGAMTYGLIMGIYWAAKYIFFILSLSVPTMSVVYLALTLVVPVLAYHMTRRYQREIGGRVGFFHAWQFGVLLYFFAALILSVESYVFYRYIAPPGFVEGAIGQMAETFKESQMGPEMVEALSQIKTSPIQMTIQGIFNNVFYGLILSIPVAALVIRHNTSVPDAGGEER